MIEAVNLWLKAILGFGRGLCAVPGRELKSGKRTHPISGVTIHESVCEKVGDGPGSDPEDVLAARGLSVHRTVHRPDDEAGEGVETRVTTHVLIDRAAWHAGTWHNQRDVGIEIENRYRPKVDSLDLVGAPINGKRDIIAARWAWKGKRKHRLYVAPAISQLEALWAQILVIAQDHGLTPWFPAVTAKGFKWGRSAAHKNRADGKLAVVAHYRWAHADGLVPEHYCWLRSLGHTSETAYRETLRAGAARKTWTLPPTIGA